MSLTWLCQAPVTEHFERSCNERFAWKQACRNTGCMRWLDEYHRSQSSKSVSLSTVSTVRYTEPSTRRVRVQATTDATIATLHDDKCTCIPHTAFALAEGQRRHPAEHPAW